MTFSTVQCFISQSRGTGDNLDQFRSDTSLTSTVILESQTVKKFTSVLRGVLHSSHTGRLLRSSVVQKSQPHVGSDVQFIKSRVACVLVRDLLVIKFTVGHSGEEAFTRHKLDLPDVGANGRDEFVVVHNDLVLALSSSDDVLRDSHAGGIVHWHLRVGDTPFDKVGHGPLQASASLIANGHDSDFRAVVMSHELTQLLQQERVDTTAHTFVRSNWDEEVASTGRGLRGTTLHVLVSLEHHINSAIAEVFASFESVQVALHL